MKKHLLVALLCGSAPAFAQTTEGLLSIADPGRSGNAGNLPLRHAADEAPAPPMLELLSFEASAKGSEGVLVRWATASERPGERFMLERSSDLMHWEIILEADGDGGADEVTRYEALDRKPLDGVSYYRLVQEENQEIVELSDLYSVRFDTGHALVIHADHAPGRFVVSASGPISELLLLNNRGQFVPMEMEHEGDRVRVHSELLASGTYYVKAVVNGNQVMRPVVIGSGFVTGG